ncbi:MAG TPA: hypothetical protein VGL77_18060, partial [Armatimonadota bacterium]
MEAQDISQQWLDIKQHMRDRKFSTVIRESGNLIENLLKNIIRNYAHFLPHKNRHALFQLEESIGKGVKGVETFEMGFLV